MDFKGFLAAVAQALSNEYTKSGELFIAAQDSELHPIDMFCYVTKKGDFQRNHNAILAHKAVQH